MPRSPRRICVRCSFCDELHMAAYDGTVNTAVGPVRMYAAECPTTGGRDVYAADEEVVLP